MDIALFAIIGAKIDVNAWYWICFGAYCFFRLYNAIKETIKEVW